MDVKREAVANDDRLQAFIIAFRGAATCTVQTLYYPFTIMPNL